MVIGLTLSSASERTIKGVLDVFLVMETVVELVRLGTFDTGDALNGMLLELAKVLEGVARPLLGGVFVLAMLEDEDV